jgi:colanic acid biosynthesis glycosyl transferase WcaI
MSNRVPANPAYQRIQKTFCTMRITIVNQYYEPDLSPTARLAASLAEHRAALGDEVTVVTSAARYASDEVKEVDKTRTDNLQILRICKGEGIANSIAARMRQYLGFYFHAIRQLVTLRRQDVIICLTTPPYIAWAGVFHKWRRGSKLILWSMDVYPDILETTRLIKPCGVIARLLRFMNRRLFRQIEHVVCLDEAMKQRLSKYAPPQLRMTVIPNWEPLGLFRTDQHIAPWPEIGQLGLVERFIVLYLGNAGYGHEFETVLDAAAQLRNEPLTFLFVGGGSKRAEIAAEATRRNLDNIVLHGYVTEEQRVSVLAAADLALITLDDETLGAMCPSKLHAKLAMGLPVMFVGPAGGNVDRAISDFRCGISLRHGQASDLAAFAREMLNNRDQLAEMKKRARFAFEQAYCDHVNLAAFDVLIDSMKP